VADLVLGATGGTPVADFGLVLTCTKRLDPQASMSDCTRLLLHLASFDETGNGLLPMDSIMFALHAPLGCVTVDKPFEPLTWKLTLLGYVSSAELDYFLDSGFDL
jgi:hypothetical protein